jgi:hypothetical protein
MSPPDAEIPKVVSLREWSQGRQRSTAKDTPKSPRGPRRSGPQDPPDAPPRTATLLGREVDTNNPVEIGVIERRSSLYVLGKPGMGKSTLLVNLISQDIDNGNSLFFLDPHGEAIQTVFRTNELISANVADERVYLLDPADEDYSFGINPLFCTDLSSRNARNAAFNKAYNIFKRVWESDNQWGLWLSLILRNTLPVLIETQQTLAEMPLFLNNRNFREYLLRQVRYNASSLDFWKHEFRPEQAQPALVRVRALLGEDDYVRDIVGQQKTTIDFRCLTTDISARFLFLRLPPNLNDETARFIGTIVATELLHAIRARTGENVENTYCLFVDEFQHFATDQFAEFINEGRKFGCATTIAHQERVGQFGENQKVLGATLACANKVLFQVTVKDARELAPEFAEKPVPLETRLVPEMVVCKDPMWHLLRRGHKNDRIQELFRKYLLREFDNLTRTKDEIEQTQLIRSGYFDEAMLYRDHASLSGVDEKREGRLAAAARGRDITISNAALDRTEGLLLQAMQQHGMAKEASEELRGLLLQMQGGRERIHRQETFLTALMEGDITTKDERLAEFFTDVLAYKYHEGYSYSLRNLYKLYFELAYGDPTKDRVLKTHITLRPMPQPLTKDSVNEPFELLQFALTYFPAETELAWFQWKYNIYYAGKSPEEVKKRWEKHKAILYAGGEWIECKSEWDRKVYGLPERRFDRLIMDDIPLGVFSDSELARAEAICREEIKLHGSPDFFTKINEVMEFCQLFAQPENHILVASGQYVEKPVQIASTQEMTNQALQTLTELPRFTAYAKTITEENGEQTIWKGKIKTLPTPTETNDPAIEERIIALTRRAYCKPRSAIEQEILQRRERWRKTEPPSPEGGPGKQPEKVQQEPPSPWTEC